MNDRGPDRPTVVLFDIDGTLLTTSGAGRAAFQQALDELYGDGEQMLNFDFAGMTDPGVARRCLRRADVEPTDERVRRIFRRYVELLPDSIEETSGYTIHPGVEELVDDLYRFHGDSLALGLGTGNIERGARLKLDPGDLNPYFDFGGFGSDAVERSELIRAGARRGSDHVDCPFADCRVVVIGDTPLDVRAARAIDAEALTVGTGGATEEELHASDPDYHFETLAEPDVRRVILDS